MRPHLRNLSLVLGSLVSLLPSQLPTLRAADLSISLNQGQVQLSWPDAGSDKVYTLQGLTDFNHPQWAPLLPWDDWPTANNSFIQTIDWFESLR